MKNNDIRWLQRFTNYSKVLSQLEKFIKGKSLNELEKQGMIQSFEYNLLFARPQVVGKWLWRMDRH